MVSNGNFNAYAQQQDFLFWINTKNSFIYSKKMQPLAMAAATACMCHRKRLRCYVRAEALNALNQN